MVQQRVRAAESVESHLTGKRHSRAGDRLTVPWTADTRLSSARFAGKHQRGDCDDDEEARDVTSDAWTKLPRVHRHREQSADPVRDQRQQRHSRLRAGRPHRRPRSKDGEEGEPGGKETRAEGRHLEWNRPAEADPEPPRQSGERRPECRENGTRRRVDSSIAWGGSAWRPLQSSSANVTGLATNSTTQATAKSRSKSKTSRCRYVAASVGSVNARTAAASPRTSMADRRPAYTKTGADTT